MTGWMSHSNWERLGEDLASFGNYSIHGMSHVLVTEVQTAISTFLENPFNLES